MADDQDARNDVEDENDPVNYDDIDGGFITESVENPTTPPSTLPINDDTINNIVDDNNGNNGNNDYDDDEPLPDVTVKLYINDEPQDQITDIVNAGVIDGSTTPLNGLSTSLTDSIDSYTSAITQSVYEQVNGTDVGGKKFLGSWSWHKALIVALIALCIIGIIIALVALINKRYKKNQGTSGGQPKAKDKGRGGASSQSGYSSVPTNV